MCYFDNVALNHHCHFGQSLICHPSGSRRGSQAKKHVQLQTRVSFYSILPPLKITVIHFMWPPNCFWWFVFPNGRESCHCFPQFSRESAPEMVLKSKHMFSKEMLHKMFWLWRKKMAICLIRYSNLDQFVPLVLCYVSFLMEENLDQAAWVSSNTIFLEKRNHSLSIGDWQPLNLRVSISISGGCQNKEEEIWTQGWPWGGKVAPRVAKSWVSRQCS